MGSKIQFNIEDIPHGHGLSFKKGVSDGLLQEKNHENKIHPTNKHSYERGLVFGNELKSKITNLVKD